MSRYFDALETRTADQRANDLSMALPQQIAPPSRFSWILTSLGMSQCT